MQTHELVPHPAHPPLMVRRMEARVLSIGEAWVRLRWRVDGVTKLVIPKFGGKGRADGLWNTTCFEAFTKPPGGDAYTEFNFSPSERWAAYEFASRREGMEERPMVREPDCTMRVGLATAIFDAAVPRISFPDPPASVGLCAVIEEEGGVKSYWALRHGGDEPDFHDPACFTANLGPPKPA